MHKVSAHEQPGPHGDSLVTQQDEKAAVRCHVSKACFLKTSTVALTTFWANPLQGAFWPNIFFFKKTCSKD